MSTSSLSELFSKANKYTWYFSIGCNPSNISVMAFTVEEARQQVLSKLRKITYLLPEFNRLNQLFRDSRIDWYTMKDMCLALENQLNIDNNVGCYCLALFDYKPSLKVRHSLEEEITLEKLISEVEPTISKINAMSVYSCLDG